MQDIINQFIGGLKLGRKQSYKNLTGFALLSDYNADSDTSPWTRRWQKT